MKFDPKDIVEHLRHNLERYPYGDGFTVLRELLQNADDARSASVSMRLLNGWSKAANPLLHGPGILLVNDGDFNAHSAQGMLTFGGSVKASDQEAVGRFGLGQKSVFHLCDAFVVVPHGHGDGTEPFVVNPFETLGQQGDDCLLWAKVSREEAALIAVTGTQLITSSRCLNLWFPLRRPGLRPKPKSRGIVASDIAPESLQPLAERWRLAEMLASLRHLRRIDVQITGTRVEVHRGDAPRMTGYELRTGERAFGGPLGEGLTSLGRERMGPAVFRFDLRQSESWPRSRNQLTDEEEPQKAAPHGAAILLADPQGRSELSVDWSVLLPVAEAMSARPASGNGRLKLLLHSCFFVDSGRKAVRGLQGKTDETSDEARVRADWNRALRDDLVLPLVPAVLHDALSTGVLSSEALAAAVAALSSSDFGRRHRNPIASEHVLARVVEVSKGGTIARWRLVPAEATLRPLPAPDERGRVALADLLPDLAARADGWGLTLVCGPECLLAADPPCWRPEELADLLNQLAPTVFTGDKSARTLAEVLVVAASADEALRKAAAEPVLNLLRQALASERPLAAHEGIRHVLSAIDGTDVVALPPAASDRFVLRSLAAAAGGPVCLPKHWLGDWAAGRTNLMADEALPLIEALQPLLRNDKQAEAAGAAGASILRCLGDLGAALAHQALRRLSLVRVLDGHGSRLVSLAELDEAGTHRRLFRDSPSARKRLGLLAVVQQQCAVFILPDAVARELDTPATGFALIDLSPDAVCRIVPEIEAFGPPSARADLLVNVFTEELAHRGALRALATGDQRALQDSVQLLALRETKPALDALILRLIAGSGQEVLVPAEIMDRLDRTKARHLSVRTLDGEELGALFIRHAERLATCGLDKGAVEAMLCADIPDEHLRQLPILPTADGRWVRSDHVYRGNLKWPLPATLSGLVAMLTPVESREARAKAEALVRLWSPEAQIDICLGHEEPSRFASEILSAVALGERSVLGSLRKSAWLRDRQSRAWAPEDVLDLPEDVLGAARKVLGDDLPFLPVSDLAVDIRDHAGFSALRDKQVLPDKQGSVERLLLIVEDVSPVAYMGEPTAELADALARLARGGTDLPLPGWPLMKPLLADGQDAPELLRAFAAVERGQVANARQWLGALAGIAEGRGTVASDVAMPATTPGEAARCMFLLNFRQLCTWDIDEVQSVLSGVPVPVQDGSWRAAEETVARAAGIAPSHRLDKGLESAWPQPDTERPNSAIREIAPARALMEAAFGKGGPASRKVLDAVCAASLVPIIQRLAVDLPNETIALLVGIVRRTDEFKALVRQQGIPEGVLDRIWCGLQKIEDECFVPQQPGQSLANIRQKTFLLFELTRPQTVEVETLTGERRELPAGALESMTVIGDTHRSRSSFEVDGGQKFWMRCVAVFDAQAPIEAWQFKRLVCTIARECLGFQDRCIDALETTFDECLRVEQVTVEDARARLEDRLPQVLAELKPERGTAPRQLLDHYETKEQSFPLSQRHIHLPEAKRKLWNGLASPQASSQVLDLIHRGIENYGYGPSRVIFELFQNADDANLQHMPPVTPECRVDCGSDRFRIVHWGRLINHLGGDAGEGERNRWQHDLFNMLVMNLSEKRQSVTGRFGLGFKSVHLIAREVGIASGFVSCRVKGGMLPDVWEGGSKLSFEATRAGRRATVIDLEIDPDRRGKAEDAIAVFRRCARWLPATARVIRDLVLDGQHFAARFTETGAAGIRHVTFEGAAAGQALAIKLDEDTTLFLLLGSDGPEPLPGGLPRLWLLAPLEEECHSKWLLNSYGFKVDPGRGRLKGSIDERRNLFRRFARVLGVRLVALYDLIEADWTSFAASAGIVNQSPERGRARFLEKLVRLFATDVAHDAGDDRLETYLHREGGLSDMVSKCPALPTGMPRPFASFLRADEVRWQITGPLAEKGRLVQLEGWKALGAIQQTAVCKEAADLLWRLGGDAPPEFGAAQLVRAELGADKRADTAVAARLGRLLDAALLIVLPVREQQELLKAAAEAKFLMSDGSWCEARLVPRDAADADEEEKRILVFAPGSVAADGAYRGEALAFYRLAARQSGFQRTAETLANWAQVAAGLAERRALVAYVVEGVQGDRLGSLLAKDRPHWLPVAATDLRQSELLDGLNEDQRGRLLTILYPSLARDIARGIWETFDLNIQEDKETPPDPAEELIRILAWWRAEHGERRRDYDFRILPNGFQPGVLRDREAADDRVGWFTFFALGIFRTIGWNNEGAHKSFVEGAMRVGWWQDMATARLPEDPGPWLRQLEAFADAGAWRIAFPQWRRTLADLYVLARWLPDYVEAFQLLPRIVEGKELISLSNLWRLSAEPIWQRRGLEGAPLTQSLGLGANWMIREAVRHGLWPEEEAAIMHPYGWAATARLRRFFDERLWHSLGERGTMDLSPQIYGFVKIHLGTNSAFLGDLDMPLQLWDVADFGAYSDLVEGEEADV